MEQFTVIKSQRGRSASSTPTAAVSKTGIRFNQAGSQLAKGICPDGQMTVQIGDSGTVQIIPGEGPNSRALHIAKLGYAVVSIKGFDSWVPKGSYDLEKIVKDGATFLEFSFNPQN